MFYKMLGIFKVMLGLTNQETDDVGQFLGHSICDGPPTGEHGPQGVPDYVFG